MHTSASVIRTLHISECNTILSIHSGREEGRCEGEKGKEGKGGGGEGEGDKGKGAKKRRKSSSGMSTCIY